MPSRRRQERIKKLMSAGMTKLNAEREALKIEKKEQEEAQRRAAKQK